MKKTKTIFALILTALLALSLPVAALAQASDGYDIINPYDSVDWESWKCYKAQLHSHTRYSDGKMHISDVVEEYYRQGYDILAITDHGVVNKGWNIKPDLVPISSYYQYISLLKPLSEERYAQITSGSDREGRPMLDVAKGIEMNGMVIQKNHVNGYFCGWGQGDYGIENDFETPVKNTHLSGGISVINHPGDFIKSSGDVSIASDIKNIRFFGDLFLKYESCVGMEIFNRIDTVVRNDRILWDNILQYTIPHGVNVWGFSNDDSHILSDIGLTAEYFMMPELSNAALKTAMQEGTFFACSKIARNELGNDFVGNGEYAQIERITVNDEDDSISLNISSASPYSVEWISNGEIIAVGDSINLSEHRESISCYVRAQIKNEGGIVMTQAFICDDGNLPSLIKPSAPEKQYTGIFGTIIELFRLIKNTKIFVLLTKAFEAIAKR